MDIGAMISSSAFGGSRSSGTISISSESIDVSGKNLSREEKSTLTAVATLQGESSAHTYSRYGLTKHVTQSQGIAFTGGIEVHNVNDYLRALESSAEMQGGRDRFGVRAEEYGRLVDIYA